MNLKTIETLQGNESYREVLRRLHWDFSYKSPRNVEQKKNDAYNIMQRLYPGNYQITEVYDHKIHSFNFKLVFDSPEEESFFLIKYSKY